MGNKPGGTTSTNGATNEYSSAQEAGATAVFPQSPSMPITPLAPPELSVIPHRNNIITQFDHPRAREELRYQQQESVPLQYKDERKPDDLPDPIVGEVVIALHDFKPSRSGEISCRQGDAMLVDKEIDVNYLWVRHLIVKQEGCIARASVFQEWYFGAISRKDAEILLQKDKNEDGAFLVRKSVNSDVPFHEYSLSCRFSDSTKSTVNHFRIYFQNGVYFLNKCFQNFRELINYYGTKQEGMKMVLGKPCERSFPRYEVEIIDWEISRSQVKLLEKLGSGNFGDVWLGELNGNIQVAVKTLKETNEYLEQETAMAIEAFLEEAALMKLLRHRHVLPLYAVCTTELPIYIITEFMDRGSLLEVLREKTTIDNLKKRIVVAYQIASGMLYLQKEKVIHRDLAARNVLVNSEFDCKICDFGLAKFCQEYTIKNENKFPIKWAAPECAHYQKYTIKSDVWSFGIVLIEIFTNGRVPYPGMTNQEVLMKISQGYRMEKPPECPDDLFDEIIQKCWEEDGINRPGFYSIVDYLDSYDPLTASKYH